MSRLGFLYINGGLPGWSIALTLRCLLGHLLGAFSLCTQACLLLGNRQIPEKTPQALANVSPLG